MMREGERESSDTLINHININGSANPTSSFKPRSWDLSDTFKDSFVCIMKRLADIVPETQKTCMKMQTCGFLDACNILEAGVQSLPQNTMVIDCETLYTMCNNLIEETELQLPQRQSSSNIHHPHTFLAPSISSHSCNSRSHIHSHNHRHQTRAVEEEDPSVFHTKLDDFLKARTKEINLAYSQGFQDAINVVLKWSHATEIGNTLNCSQFYKFLKFQIERVSSSTQLSAPTNSPLETQQLLQTQTQAQAQTQLQAHGSTMEEKVKGDDDPCEQNQTPNISKPASNVALSCTSTTLSTPHRLSSRQKSRIVAKRSDSNNKSSPSSISIPSTSSLHSQHTSAFHAFVTKWVCSSPSSQSPLSFSMQQKKEKLWLERAKKRDVVDEEDDIVAGLHKYCNLQRSPPSSHSSSLQIFHPKLTPLSKYQSKDLDTINGVKFSCNNAIDSSQESKG